MNSEHQTEEGRGIKKRHVVPCFSGVLVEDRQCRKRAKTAKQPSKGSSRRSTKTDLLMSVFAKSRQRNSYINTAAAGHSVSAQPPFCNTSFSGSHRSVRTFGNIAEAESESDSGSLATSVSTGNLAMSSDDERMVRGRRSKKQKREKRKVAALWCSPRYVVIHNYGKLFMSRYFWPACWTSKKCVLLVRLYIYHSLWHYLVLVVVMKPILTATVMYHASSWYHAFGSLFTHWFAHWSSSFSSKVVDVILD